MACSRLGVTSDTAPNDRRTAIGRRQHFENSIAEAEHWLGITEYDEAHERITSAKDAAARARNHLDAVRHICDVDRWNAAVRRYNLVHYSLRYI